MEKIRIKELVQFRRKSDRSKKTFVKNLKSNQESDKDNSGGGDYWKSCLSAIGNVFKYNDEYFLDEKIALLNEKIGYTEDKRIKTQFQRNVDILTNFTDFDFKEIKPNASLTFHKKPIDKSILDINGIPLQAKPDHVFSFSINNSEEIGGVWFIAQIDGYNKEELGMFVDILYRYLYKHFSKDFYVNTTYCIAVDVYKGQYVSYEDIEKGYIPKLIEQTIDEIKSL
ncbi:MAG: hypothetical protein K9I74_08050 [Bacteroidales bacterium]|nr:hypothetical protein [Bacteroidales bacterium]